MLVEFPSSSSQITLVILLGASEWPYSPDFGVSEAFANSAHALQEYFLDPRRFNLPTENLLNLFDSNQNSDEIDHAIGLFLDKRSSELKASGYIVRDVLIYFVGHAGFAEDDFDYYLAIRRTRKENRMASSIRIVSLAHTLKEKARRLRRILILDCCFAASAAMLFQGSGPSQIAIARAIDAFKGPKKTKHSDKTDSFPTKGTSLLCSSSRRVPSLILHGENYTAFSKALLYALNTGDPQQQELMSLRTVADLTVDFLLSIPQGGVPRPEVHSPDQGEGDVADVPFFPNPARRTGEISLASTFFSTVEQTSFGTDKPSLSQFVISGVPDMTPLDIEIQTALDGLHNPESLGNFDVTTYKKVVRANSHRKAKAVIELLNDSRTPFSRSTPVFVSIGGGDGEEIDYLLRHTHAQCGILLEESLTLAEKARERLNSLPADKTLYVFEGSVQEKVSAAIAHALELVHSSKGDFIAITCHRALHELFDRGKTTFDSIRFFTTIFQDDLIATWFTYAESGVPEQWPQTVIIEANCSSRSLFLLIEAIRSRHPMLRELSPVPHLVGNHVRLHAALAIECLDKLLHLSDLHYEMQIRSTAVEHSHLVNALWLSIGETAKQENSANIQTSSSLMDAFTDLCQKYEIKVSGLNDDNSTIQLAIAESLTRVVAWRLGPTFRRKTKSEAAPKQTVSRRKGQRNSITPDLIVASEALASHDDALLCALLASKARAWIESPNADAALRLLRTVRFQHPPEHFGHLWSHYNLSLASLFKGDPISPEWFSPALEERAEQVGLGILFRAERMEFNRRIANTEIALDIANTLITTLPMPETIPDNDIRRYALATTYFLVASLLREGGLYQTAWQYINSSQAIYRPGIPSHDTELAHCYYAKTLCGAITGISSFDTPFDSMDGSNDRQFATALITLTYSYAAWFTDDINRARQFALDAAQAFLSIGYTKYASRAQDLALLLEWWDILETSRALPDNSPNTRLYKLVSILVGIDNDIDWLLQVFPTLRPSQALGLLQFAKYFRKQSVPNLLIPLPRILTLDDTAYLQWHPKQLATSLEEADQVLRQCLKISPERRLPLLADAT